MVLRKKVKRTILEKKALYLGSIVLIMFSTMLFSSLNIAGFNLKGNLESFREENVLEDDFFILQNQIDDIPALEKEYNLTLEERYSYDYKVDEDTTLRILSETEKINKYAIVAGEPLRNKNEILIDPSFAKVHDIELNSEIKIKGTDYKVVGFMSLPDYTYPLKSENELLRNPNTFGLAVMTKEAVTDFNKGLLFYSVKFSEDNKEEFISYLNQNNYIVHWVNKDDNNRIKFIESDISSIIKLGKYLPIAILFMTIILVSIIVWRLLKAEYVEIGTLYALGYRKREILKHYLSYPIFISLLGGLLGIILGMLLVEPLLEMYGLFYNLPLIDIEYSLDYLFGSFLLPFLFLLPVTILIIYKVLRLSPLVLMRGGGNKTKINFIERSLKLNRFSFKTKFKIREIIRNIPRTILLILGVTFASMLYLMGFVMMDSMNYLINNSYDEVYEYNYDYIYNSFQIGKPAEGEALTFSPFTSDKTDKSIVIYGLQEDAELIKLRDLEGNLIDLNNTIVSKSLADKIELKEGDELKVKNKLNSKEFTLQIDKIADYYLGDYIFMPINTFNSLNGYPENSYLEVYSKKELNISEDKLLMKNEKEDLLNSFETMLEPLNYMIGIIGLFAFIIGLIVMYVVTSLLIEENKLNISLFKVLGYKKKEIYSLIFGSNTILIIIGYLLSIPILFTSLNKFFMIITEEMNVAIPIRINEKNVVIGFILIYITYLVSNALNKKRVNKIQMTDVLKSRAE